MALDDLGIIRVLWKLFSPCKIVLRCSPFPIIDVGVTTRNLVDQDVPGELGSNTPYFPVGALLQYRRRTRQLYEEFMIRGSCGGGGGRARSDSCPEFLRKVQSRRGSECRCLRPGRRLRSTPCLPQWLTGLAYQWPCGDTPRFVPRCRSPLLLSNDPEAIWPL